MFPEQQGTVVTCASCPLVSANMRSIVEVYLAMFWGSDIQATVPLDGNLTKEVLEKQWWWAFEDWRNMF